MNKKFIVSATIFWPIVFILNPTIFLKINQYLGWPSFKNSIISSIGAIMIIIGILLIYKTTINFIKLGNGSPSPFAPTKKLVRCDIYDYSRNPMYIGYLILLLGEFLFTGQYILLFYTFLFFICINAFLIFYEEPELTKKFGPEYMEYCDKTPRWIGRKKDNDID